MTDKFTLPKIPSKLWNIGGEGRPETGKEPKAGRPLLKVGGRGNESPRGEHRGTIESDSPRNDVSSPRTDVSSPRTGVAPKRELVRSGTEVIPAQVKSPRFEHTISRQQTDTPSKRFNSFSQQNHNDSSFVIPKRLPQLPQSPSSRVDQKPPNSNETETLSQKELSALERFEKSFVLLDGASSIDVKAGRGNRKTIPLKIVNKLRHPINFNLPDTEEYVTFGEVDGRKFVKTASFSKIVEKMTATVPMVEMEEVLLCYHSFCVADELLEALIIRYDATSKEDEKTVRLRILNFIKKWSGTYWYDWILDPNLSEKALDFLNRICAHATNSSSVALTVKARLENKMQFEEEKAIEQKNKQLNLGPPPDSIIPNISQPSILQYDPVEISRQITIIEWEVWSNIQHWELLSLAWTKKDKDTTAKNVVTMTDRFNLVSDWVVNVLCTTENMKTRVKYFQTFLRIADELRILGNYNGVLEIMSGLRRGPVDRLKRSLNAAIKSPIFQKIFQELDTLTNSAKAYANMRNAIKTVNPPVIPYLGMYQTDLLMTDSGNPDELNGLINYNKYRLSTETIKKIKQYQLKGYSLRVVEDLHQQLLGVLCPVKLTEVMQYDLSYYLEPREGKDQGARPVHLDTYLQAQDQMKSAYFDNFSIKKKLLEFDSADVGGESLFVEMSFIIEKAVTSSDSIFGVALLATYRQFLPASTILYELSKHYNGSNKSNDSMMRIGNLLKTWLVQYWKDFEEEPELLNQMDELFQGHDFSVYKANILQPLINKNKSFELPQPDNTVFENLDIFSLSPLDFAKQIIHYTYDKVVSKININKIFIEAASINNPRLVDFNIFSTKDQNIVLKLAIGKFAGIQGIELIAYRKKKKELNNNFQREKDCFTAKKAIEWFQSTLCCSLNGAIGWFKHFQSNYLISPVEEYKENIEIENSESLWRFNVPTPNPALDIFSWEVHDYVSNFRNNIYSHLTVIQNFVIREVKKESCTLKGPLALHQFLLIGQELIKHHNWYSALALMAALNSLITPEFQHLWVRIPPKDRQWFMTIRGLMFDSQELKKTIYSIPTLGPFNSSFTMIHILVDDLTVVNRKYPNVVDSENKVNLRRILELSRILEAHTRTSSIFPPNFPKLQQIQNFIVTG